ncbi:MAG TPA: PAS domain-containing protein [Candidatus Avacidaminococcus intestinavium]|uniref:PAS domain-containing protein n=1 Tax=Candidatus Avacidaminococcus intestinavium TaxID=2840684 RepID=A0A9D1MPQ8_9FIRM|nr:PAS domain-containing protein [Candidatus Avacidaminococcus intestinavium]
MTKGHRPDIAMNNEDTNKNKNRAGFHVVNHVMDNIVWRVNFTSMKIMDISSVVKSVLGYEVEEVIGVDIRKIVMPESYNQLLKYIPLWQKELNGNIFRSLHIVGRIEHTMKDSDLTKWVEVNAQVFVRSNGELIAVGVSREESNKETLFSLYNELAEQRKILQETLDMQPCYLSCYDPDGKYLFVNQRFADYWGCDKNEIIGKPIFGPSRVHLDDKEKHKNLFARAQKGLAGEFIDSYTSSNGNSLEKEWAYGQYFPVIDEFGKVTKIFVSVVDITEQYKLKQQLVEAELVGRTDSWRLNLETDELFCSPGVMSLYGINEDDIAKKSYYAFLDCYKKEYRQVVIDKVQEAIAKDLAVTLEIECNFPDGQAGWIRLSCSMMKNNEGKPYEVLGRVEDITNQKKLEVINKNNTERLRVFLRNLPGVGFITDLNGDVLEFFDEGQVLQTKSANYILNSNILELFKNDATVIKEKMRLAVERHSLQFCEGVLDYGKQKKWFKIRISRLSYGENPRAALAFYLMDVSSQVKSNLILDKDTLQRSKDILFNELIEGKTILSNSVLDQAWQLQINLVQDFSLFIILFNENLEFTLTNNQILKLIGLVESKEQAIVWRTKEGFAVLRPLVRSVEDIKKEELQYANRVQELLQRIPEVVKQTFYIGIAEFSTETFKHLPRSYKQALTAAELGRKERPEQTIFHFLDSGVFQFFPAVMQDEYMQKFIKRTIGTLEEYDKEHDTELLETLKFILKSESLKDVADSLFVHRQTVLFRKKRIEQLLKISLDDFETKLSLSMALKFKNAFFE